MDKNLNASNGQVDLCPLFKHMKGGEMRVFGWLQSPILPLDGAKSSKRDI